MEDFTILHSNILGSEHYTVHVGTVPGDKVPQYLVFHKEYGVLEYAHNNIWVIPQALAEMENHIAGMTPEKIKTEVKGDLYN